MVSALWKAASSGDLENVLELLKDSSTDIEVKDQHDVTPLIEAVRNGHVEVVRVLLDKGADPANASADGLPVSYTSDPHILELIQTKLASSTSPEASGQGQNADQEQEKTYQYGPSPPISYPYYPSIGPTPPEGSAYYPVPSTAENSGPGALGNLPPPDIARFIPCRYFPACRYGTSCLFAHPQQYFPGSITPPAQYVPPLQPYPANYYPSPPFQPPNGAHALPPISTPAGPHSGHGASPSDLPLPVQPPFSPNVLPPGPYGPISPNYPHPMMMVPPPQHQGVPQNQSTSNIYNAGMTPYIQHDANSSYPPQNLATDLQEPPVEKKRLNSQDGAINHHTSHRDGSAHYRRGRRTSFSARKPPCLFFPAGRCKNGDDCRYPHVIPDGNNTYHSGPSGRGPKGRHQNGNGVSTAADKLSGLNLKEGNTEGSAHPETGRRFHQGGKNGTVNGTRHEKRMSPMQRVPNADEFPVLSGSTTPPSRASGGNGKSLTGPTAAQVLQAPPPRKETPKQSSTRGTTPDSVKPASTKAEPNGPATEMPNTSHNLLPTKLPVSFASVAAPDIPKEIALPA